jgi:transposase
MVSLHRNFLALESRRMKAAEYFATGQQSQAWIARKLHVSRQSVSRWYAQWQRQGQRALMAAGRAGRKPRLTAEQLGQVAQSMLESPPKYGLSGHGWTVERAAQLIEKLTGVRYHRGHVWKMLNRIPWEIPVIEAERKKGHRQIHRRWLVIKKMLQSKP